MNQAITYLDSIGVPTASRIDAGKYMNQHLPEVDKAKEIIKSVTDGLSVSERGQHKLFVPFVAAYVVQLAVTNYLAQVEMSRSDLLAQAKVSAANMIENNAWAFAGVDTKADIEDADPEAVKAGQAKKGARKVLGLRVYQAQIAGKEMTRKEAIAILMTEVGLTAAGASTYFANFKSGKWA